MSAFPDPITAGLARGWNVRDTSDPTPAPTQIDCDVAIVGSGAFLDGVVVGDRAVIGPGNELVRGARVWPGVALGDTAVRFSSDR